MLPFIIGAAIVAGVAYVLNRGDKHSTESLEFHLRFENQTLKVIHGNPRPRIISAVKYVLRDENGAASIYLTKGGIVNIEGDLSEQIKQRIRNTIAAEK